MIPGTISPNRLLPGILAAAGLILASAGATPAGESGGINRCAPGPWGDIEYFEIQLRPSNSLLNLIPDPPPRTVWRFANLSLDQLRELFRSLPVSDEIRASLADESGWVPSEDGFELTPSDEVILGLSPDARMLILRVLNAHTHYVNDHYISQPLIFTDETLDKLAASRRISTEHTELIRQLSIRTSRNLLIFSDVAFLLNRLNTREERQRMLQTLLSRRSLMLRLRINPDTDLEAVTAYWDLGVRRKDLLSMLRAIQSNAAIETLDVVHLLPATPRKLLYTYPTLADGVFGKWRDCHWTSANFRRFTVSDRYLINSEVNQFLTKECVSATPPYRFGDILVFTNAASEVRHSCVFIADNIVFTKNGTGPHNPWLLMKIDDVLAEYEVSEKMNVVTYRPKQEH